MKRIAFIGAAGSGKSTIAEEVHVELKKKSINAELIQEWIRYDIQAHGAMTSIWEQYRTRQHQKDLEDDVPDTVDYVIVDSGTLTPYFYACLYANDDARQRLVICDMYKYLLDDIYLKRYDYVFYLPTKHTYEANSDILSDGTRYQSEDEINSLETHMGLVFTKLHSLDNIHTLDCPLEYRAEEALKIILS